MRGDDADRIRRAAAGDRRAFDELLEPRWPRLFAIALRIVGERQDAEDVAQQACLRLWETLDRFRPDEDLDGWIYRMVSNLSIDALRRRRARRETAAPEGGAESWPRVADAAPGPEGRLLASELERALQDVTEELAPQQKAVFVLARVEGLAPSEIARVLDLAPSTARNHLFQARAHVARKLRERHPGLLGESTGVRGGSDES